MNAVRPALLLVLAGCVPYGLDRVTVDTADGNRGAFVHVPDDLPADAPLMLTFHGGGIPGFVRGTQMALVTRMHDLADRDGFVVAYPNADGGAWSDSADAGADDLGFVRALVDDLVATHGLDPARVYASGLSNGGFFSMRLACEAPDLVAAVASISGGLLEDYTCEADTPVAMLILAQTADDVVPIEGGPVAWVASNVARSHDDVVAEQVARLGCEGDADTTEGDKAPDGTFAVEAHWTQCRGGAEVRAITVVGGGHQWPGGEAVGVEEIAGPVSEALDATEVVWQFASGF